MLYDQVFLPDSFLEALQKLPVTFPQVTLCCWWKNPVRGGIPCRLQTVNVIALKTHHAHCHDYHQNKPLPLLGFYGDP